MSGKKKSAKGFDSRLSRYKSGQNIIDELTQLNDPRLNKKINGLIDIFYHLSELIIKTNIENPHYFLTLLLHDKKRKVGETNIIPTRFLKNCLCSYYTSVYRDTLRNYQPKIFNKGKYRVN